MDADLDWRSWIRLRLAAHWFWTIVFFLDVGIFAAILTLFGRPAGSLAYVAAIAFVIPAMYLEWQTYRLLWPADEDVLAREARESVMGKAEDASPEVAVGPDRET